MESKSKKPYQPPQLTKVTLRPEEAVLGACKISTSPGPVQSTCAIHGPCNSLGS